MSPIPVVIFGDFTCPFSYVTEAALREWAEKGEASADFRAFELYPAPAPLPELAQPEGWEEMLQPLAREVGLEIRRPPLLPRTRKAHELARFAAERRAGEPMRNAIWNGYWREGRDIGRIDVLAELAERVGLDPVEARIALDIDRFTAAVENDETIARRLGIEAIPALIFGSGAAADLWVGARSRAELGEILAAHRDGSARRDPDGEEDTNRPFEG